MNPFYSQNLAQEFVREVYEKKLSNVVLWTTNRELPYDAKVLGIDWVFFAGSSWSCLSFAHLVKAVWKGQPKKPNVLLSCSCATPEVLEGGSKDIVHAFAMCPKPTEDNGPLHRGVQAYDLLRQLINGADYDFRELSIRNDKDWFRTYQTAADARNALRVYMEQSVNSERSFNLEGQQFTFLRDGRTEKETVFDVWQVESR